MTLIEKLELRVRRVHARAQVRKWQFRQRHLAHGTWDRVRRLLADARDAYEISVEEAQSLVQSGHSPEKPGQELVPPKLIFFLDEVDASNLPNARRIPVSLGTEFMAASCVALVPFPGLARNFKPNLEP